MCVAMTIAGSDDLLSLLLKNLQFPVNLVHRTTFLFAPNKLLLFQTQRKTVIVT